MSERLFHILRPEDWERAQSVGEYRPPSLEQEGFIHLSAAHQVRAVLEKLYHGERNLQVLVIDAARLQAPLRWEPPAGILPDGLSADERFPHLYGALNLDAVVDILTDLEVLHDF